MKHLVMSLCLFAACSSKSEAEPKPKPRPAKIERADLMELKYLDSEIRRIQEAATTAISPLQTRAEAIRKQYDLNRVDEVANVNIETGDIARRPVEKPKAPAAAPVASKDTK